MEVENEIKLKTCPFCGAVARLQKWYTGYVVECKFCGVSSVAGDTQERAASIWNDRAGEPSSNTAARDALRRIDMLLVSMNCDSAQKRVVDTCRMIVKQALSAPARNCDVYDAKTAEKEFVRQTGSKSIRTKSVRWLYAPINGGNCDGK